MNNLGEPWTGGLKDAWPASGSGCIYYLEVSVTGRPVVGFGPMSVQGLD